MLNSKKIAVLFFLLLTACSPDQKPIIYLQSCALDSIQGAKSVPPNKYLFERNGSISFNGWIADIPSYQVPTNLKIMALNKQGFVAVIASGNVEISRPDVVEVFQSASLLKSGYKLVTDINKIPNGIYSLQLVGNYRDYIGVCPVSIILEII